MSRLSLLAMAVAIERSLSIIDSAGTRHELTQCGLAGAWLAVEEIPVAVSKLQLLQTRSLETNPRRCGIPVGVNISTDYHSLLRELTSSGIPRRLLVGQESFYIR